MKILSNKELNLLLKIISEKAGKDTAQEIAEYIQILKSVIKDKQKRILEIAAILKEMRELFLKAQASSDIYKRTSSYFENLAKDYGLEIDLTLEDDEEENFQFTDHEKN